MVTSSDPRLEIKKLQHAIARTSHEIAEGQKRLAFFRDQVRQIMRGEPSAPERDYYYDAESDRVVLKERPMPLPRTDHLCQHCGVASGIDTTTNICLACGDYFS